MNTVLAVVHSANALRSESRTFVDPENTGWWEAIPTLPPSPAIADDEPGTDGDFLDEPTGPDDEHAEWAAKNLNDADCHNTGWVEGEPDLSAIELFTSSAWDRFLDDLAADREAEARVEAGCLAC